MMKKLIYLLLLVSLSYYANATDYHVGPGQSMAAIAEVPWATLEPGDRVYIHWRSTPYKEKWVITRKGTAANPIEIIGISNGSGQKPVIDGNGATTPAGVNFWNEERGVIKLGGSVVPEDLIPEYIILENLEVRSGHENYQFTDDSGNVKSYARNSAGIYIEKGINITIRRCVVTDNGNGIFIGSSASAISQNILIEHNYLYDNGVVNSAYEHNSYTSANGITFQYNRYGNPKAGSLANNLKDRSAGTVVRYNWIEGGSRQLDLVDASDKPGLYNLPSYRSTYVYGNTIIESDEYGGGNYTMIHYGGDSPGQDDFRKGTLYLYNNTISTTRTGITVLVQPSTNDETVEAFNNVIYTSGSLLAVTGPYGTLNISNNWIIDGWLDCYCSNSGTINDAGNNITGTDPMFVNFGGQDFNLAAGSPLINMGAGAAPSGYEVTNQYVKHTDFVTRPTSGTLDIGAYEYGSASVDPPVITTGSLGDGKIGNLYYEQLTNTGSQNPFTWSISSGVLPAGLSLAGTTGIISGTPTALGQSSFTVLLTDNDGATDSKNFTIDVVIDYTLTTNVTGSGSIDPSSGTFQEGTSVTLTATPNAGWQFDGWSGDLSGTTNPVNITMDVDKTITATFSLQSGLINIAVASVTASSSQDPIEYGPQNTIDNDLATRWSAEGEQWISYDLGSVYTVSHLDMAFFSGSARSAIFNIELSTDGTNWTQVFDGQSSGTTSDFESFDFTDASARYVRINGQGNISNSWNSYLEVDIYGFSASGTQYTLTTNTSGNGSVSGAGTYDEDTVVSITATPDAGWQFDAWSGDLSGTANPANITMDADKTVIATFSQIATSQFTLTTNTSGNGSVSGAGTYNEGTVVSVTATPDAGWQFDAWSGDLTGTTNPANITMDGDKTVTANFSETAGGGATLLVDFGSTSSGDQFGLSGWNTAITDVYTTNVAIGPGGTAITVASNGAYNYQGVSGSVKAFSAGEKVTVTWYNNTGAAINFTPYISFNDSDRRNLGSSSGTWYAMSSTNVPANGSATSEFVFNAANAGNYSLVNVNSNYSNSGTLICDKIDLSGSSVTQYTLTTSTTGNGSVTGAGTYDDGTVVSVTATPDAGWQFDGWSGDLSGTANPANITMDSDKNITAAFSQIATTQYTLSTGTSGSGSVSGAGTYDDGTVVSVTATPGVGWQFDGWSGDLSGTANPANITMDSDKTITAAFSQIATTQYTLTTSTSGNGSVSGAGTYDDGTVVSVTATPDSGWQFDGWSGDLSGSTNPANITMNADKTVTAMFSQQGGGTPVNLLVSSFTASPGSEGGNGPENTIDDNMSSRWAASGDHWISYDLGAIYTISYLDISFYANYTYLFDIEISDDGASWVQVFTGQSSGTGGSFETIDFVDTSGRYVRFVGNQNTHPNSWTGAWNGIYELDIYGIGNGSGSRISKYISDVNELLDKDVFKLEQNYPNPVTSFTTINYTLSQDEFVYLQVVDMTGRRIAELVNGNMSSGQHSVALDITRRREFTAGTYLVTIQAGSNFSAIRMIVK